MTLLSVEDIPHLLRRKLRFAGHFALCRTRQYHCAARAEWRRQDNHDPLDHRLHAGTPRPNSVQGRGYHPGTAYAVARRGIGLVPQGRRIFGSLTVEEQITLGLDRKQGRWVLDRLYNLFPQLKERRRQRAITLSGGEQSMLSIGRALLMNPDLLLLDEPTEGLAPLIVDQVAATIQTLKLERQTIILVEQDLALALDLADDVYIMNKGTIVFRGKPEELRENHQVQSQFLGV